MNTLLKLHNHLVSTHLGKQLAMCIISHDSNSIVVTDYSEGVILELMPMADGTWCDGYNRFEGNVTQEELSHWLYENATPNVAKLSIDDVEMHVQSSKSNGFSVVAHTGDEQDNWESVLSDIEAAPVKTLNELVDHLRLKYSDVRSYI